MQPYLFPYFGYFQLIQHVDKFILLDDVNYINKGWINRNNILLNSSSHLFTIPLSGASQNKLINELSVLDEFKWKNKFLKLIQTAYSKSPEYNKIFALIEKIIQFPSINLSSYILNSIHLLCQTLNIETMIIPSSEVYNNKILKAEKRILDICLKEGATEYINPIGGLGLYEKNEFEQNGIKLKFFTSEIKPYKQFNSEFVPYLSVIDTLMFLSVKEINSKNKEFSLS